MDVTDQKTAFADSAALATGETARFWRAPRYDDLECLAARFVSHRYRPHTHDTYVVGVIVEGCETYVVNGRRRYAQPGEFCVVHPGEVHDGEPYGAGYAYRTAYPSISLMCEIAAEVTDGKARGAPSFGVDTVRDPEAAALFVAAHRALGDGGQLQGDERFIAAMARLISRHGRVGAPHAVGAEPVAVGRARAYLDANFAEDVDLARLARVAGLSRFHLVRAFRRQVGLTPHAWLTDRRVREARHLLARGHAPGEVASLCGFADQSHLTRCFKARIGVPPGRVRRTGVARAA